ncbi:MAG: hypothetical protein OHK93_005347, partial [Ramalina farinacea]|nr:hypothetical protein [Ramalina farinacea]
MTTLQFYHTILLHFASHVHSAPATQPNAPQQQTPHCLHRGDIPITAIPNVADCNNLARTFRTAVGSDEARVWGLKAKQWPIAFVPLPAKMSNGTCEIRVNVDGSPYYDIAKFNDIAAFIQDTVDFCLSSPFEVAIGGAAHVGANGWLTVSVTGKSAADGDDATVIETSVTAVLETAAVTLNTGKSPDLTAR